MPGHEFEKNVQQRLDELKLRPSDAVWNNVEYSIRKDKRRRRIILWFPILLLFIGTSGYFLINKNGFISAETAITKNQNEKKNNLSIPESNQENNTVYAEKPEAQKDANPVTTTKNTNDKSNEEKDITKNKSTKNSTSNNKLASASDGNKSSKHKINDDKVQVLTKDGQSINLNKEPTNALALTVDDEPIKYSDPNLSLIKGSSPIVGLTVPEKANASLETPAVDMNSLSKMNQKDIYHSSKWQWGLDFSVGTSTESSEISFAKSMAADNLGSPVIYNGNPPSSTQSTIIESGTHWSAGGFIQRNFTNRFAISAGLQYSQFSSRVITGTHVDNSTRLFYSSGNFADHSDMTNENTTRYHFLELPVDVHFKLNKSNSFPIYANTGLSIGWLLNTNSLNGNASSNIFSQNIDLYNTTQFGFHGGFTFGVLNKTKHPLQIGPSMRYNFTRLMENSTSGKHLVSFGVDVRLLLKK